MPSRFGTLLFTVGFCFCLLNLVSAEVGIGSDGTVHLYGGSVSIGSNLMFGASNQRDAIQETAKRSSMVRDAEHMKLYSLNGLRYDTFQVNSNAVSDLNLYVSSTGIPFLGVANPSPAVSSIYKWNNSSFVLVQHLPVETSRIEFFAINGVDYFIYANGESSSNPMPLYQYNSTTELFVPTSNSISLASVYDWTFCDTGDAAMLIASSYSGSRVYQWSGSSFGSTNLLGAVINTLSVSSSCVKHAGVHHLVILSESTASSVTAYKWNTTSKVWDSWGPQVTGMGTATQHIELFSASSDTLLFTVALTASSPGPSVYQWKSSGISQVQVFPRTGPSYKGTLFQTDAGKTYLLWSTRVAAQDQLYRWNSRVGEFDSVSVVDSDAAVGFQSWTSARFSGAQWLIGAHRSSAFPVAYRLI